ncbi:MAG: glycosyltransferase [Bdellovibrionales bacterium]|nr:glycosyltransferase [Bdellovibrionales bacterium]
MSVSQHIQILHEYGAPSHVQALRSALLKRIGRAPKHYTFSLFGAEGRKAGAVRLLSNLLNLASLLVSRGSVVVLGIAPFDRRMKLLRWVLRGHLVHLHTSWHKWDGSFQPHNLPDSQTAAAKIESSWRKFLQEDVSSIICVTEAGAASLKDNYEISARISVIPHSVNEGIFFPGEASANREKLRLLYVGRLIPKKGLATIFRLAKSDIANLIQVTFVGDGSSSGETAEFCKLHTNCNHLTYCQNPEKLADLFRSSDILLLPSRRTDSWEELFGIVIIEALACGVVPIATDHVGPREIIDHCRNGYLFSEDEYFTKTAKLLRELHADPKALMTMRQRAIESSKRYFSASLEEKWLGALGMRAIS